MRIEKSHFPFNAHSRRRRLSLTSLIDVLFLLLLFFMLSSTFTQFGEVNIVEQGSDNSNGNAIMQEKPEIIIQISPEKWRVNGQTASVEQAILILQNYDQKGAKNALLIMGRDSDTQNLVTALEDIRSKTNLTVSVSY